MVHDTKHGGKEKFHAGADKFAGSPPASARDFDTTEDAFWRTKYEREHYFQQGMTYDDYQPAYRFGYELRKRHSGGRFEDFERDLGSEWEKVKAKSRLGWEHAKHAVRAAWDHMTDHKEHR